MLVINLEVKLKTNKYTRSVIGNDMYLAPYDQTCNQVANIRAEEQKGQDITDVPDSPEPQKRLSLSEWQRTQPRCLKCNWRWPLKCKKRYRKQALFLHSMSCKKTMNFDI